LAREIKQRRRSPEGGSKLQVNKYWKRGCGSEKEVGWMDDGWMNTLTGCVLGVSGVLCAKSLGASVEALDGAGSFH
jgi:hypothetical protein